MQYFKDNAIAMKTESLNFDHIVELSANTVKQFQNTFVPNI